MPIYKEDQDYTYLCPYSWDGSGSNWTAYPRGINSDGRKLENHLYIQPNGEWCNTYEMPKGSQILRPGERPEDIGPAKQLNGWDQQLDYTPEPAPTYEKDKSYEHSPLPTPKQILLWQWKNTKQCKKYENKQMSWDQLEAALHENQNTGHHLSLDTTREEDGDNWTPTTGDPLDALMEEEQEEIREESRQYRLELLIKSLTKRQRKALEWKSQGLTDLEISKKMRTSRPTIQREIAKITSLAATLSEK